MRKATLFRLGVAAGLLTMGVAGAVAAGCTGDDNTTTDGGTKPGTDSGPAADTGPTVDTGTPDTNRPPVPDAGQHAKLVVVHAAPGIPAVRVCFAQGQQDDGSDGTVTALSALPDTPNPAPLPYPGIFPGTGGTFPDITDLSGIAITPYAVLASSIKDQTSDAGAGEKTCVDLIGSDGKGGILHPTDGTYIKLPTIPKSTFKNEHTYLLSVLGCLPDVTDAGFNAALCGSDWTAAGNPHVGIAELDRTAVDPDAGDYGIQFAHRSSAIEGVAEPNTGHPPATNGVIPGFLVPPGDAGPEAGPQPPSFVQLNGGPSKYSGSALQPPKADPFKKGEVDLTDPNLQFAVAFLDPQDSGAPFNPTAWPGSPLLPTGYGDVIAIPLTIIQAATTGAPPPPSMFANTGNYTFILVGDPAKTLAPAVDDAGNPTLVPTGSLQGLHVLAFPNNPPVKSL